MSLDRGRTPAYSASRRGRRRRRPRAVALGLALAIGSAASAQPVLHEYIELGPGQDLVEPVVTAQPPGPGAAAPQSGERALGGEDPGSPAGAGTAASAASEGAMAPGAPFSIDRDTTRPSRVSYEDPFTPTVVPFKRSAVYDAVTRDGELVVRDARLVPVASLGTPRPSDEHFHAALDLQLRAGEAVPIPSVAPGSRLVVAHASPPARLRLLRDSAENWFVRADSAGHFALKLQVVADRRVFGSNFRDVDWSDLARELPPIPGPVKASALEVARALGVAESLRPRQAVADLVQHFRRFRASERRPSGFGLALYRELALTARGICRHRSYAFMLTALGLGIPARMAMNEAHAWVEVWDGELWHRIDLGGAADQLEMAAAGRPQHVEPRDPFAWPDQSESGHALAARRVAQRPDTPPPSAAAPGPERASGASSASPAPAESELAAAPPEPRAPPAAEPAAPEAPVEPPAPASAPLAPGSVLLRRVAPNAERGKALFVTGRVTAGARACGGASVEVALQDARGQNFPLGTLVSDDRGDFGGTLIVPWNVPLGGHSVLARASGGCGMEALER